MHLNFPDRDGCAYVINCRHLSSSNFCEEQGAKKEVQCLLKIGILAKDMFKSALKDVGIENFRFHNLRHTAGMRLAESGEDAFTIKHILGHASIQTSAIYVYETDEGKRRAINALEHYA